MIKAISVCRNQWLKSVVGILIIASCLFALGCLSQQTVSYQALQGAVDHGHAPRIIAVLPFKNHTDKEWLGTLVRNSFYSHFSVRPYQDIELYVVDRRLRDQVDPNESNFNKAYLQELGRLLKCDAVVSGEVIDSQRIFVGVYSQLNIEVAIAIWDTRSGERIWTDQHTARKHEGGIPFSLEAIPLVTIRSGLNLLESVRIGIIDKLCRHLAGRIPAPQAADSALTKAPAWEFELQVGSFLNPTLASNLLRRLRDLDYPAYIRKYENRQGLWHRVLLGPYEDQEEAVQIQHQVDQKFGTGSFIAKVPAAMESAAE